MNCLPKLTEQHKQCGVSLVKKSGQQAVNAKLLGGVQNKDIFTERFGFVVHINQIRICITINNGQKFSTIFFVSVAPLQYFLTCMYDITFHIIKQHYSFI